MAWSKQTFIDPPTTGSALALIVFIINIFLPGVGTMIIGLLACSFETFFVGFLQLVTCWLIVGWVWSILWGWECLKVSKRRKVDLPGGHALGPDGLL